MKLLLHIPKQSKIAIYIQILVVLCVFGLIDFLHFPNVLRYTMDLILLYTIVKSIGKINRTFRRNYGTFFLLLLILIFSTSLFGGIINSISPLYYFWGFRNYSRFYLFFIVSVVLLGESDIDKLVSMIEKVFFINVIICTIQYFIMGLNGDFLGGLFGRQQGCNAYMNILLCIVWASQLGKYVMRKSSLIYTAMIAIGCLYLATLADIKLYFIEFVLFIFVAILSKKLTLRNLKIVLLGLAAIGLATFLLTVLVPDSLDFFLDAKTRSFYLGGNGYTNTGDLNRFTAIEKIYSKFFENLPLNNFFGFGLGSCDTSNFTFLQTPFYTTFGYLHYRWFSHAWIYLEQGWIGLILIFLFFFAMLFYMIYVKKQIVRTDLWIIAVLCWMSSFIGLIYNSATQTEACYLIALICAVPFVLMKDRK